MRRITFFVLLMFVAAIALWFLLPSTHFSRVLPTPTALPGVTRQIIDGKNCVIVQIAENAFGVGCKDE